MAQKQTQKVKGCRKCGRGKKRAAGKGSALSLFVRGKISAADYFKASNQSVKHA